ncbi:MAG: hypothetical protein J2P18_12665 [Nocardia sp.]|nr:hypothetical protein [Nocardia sp.]
MLRSARMLADLHTRRARVTDPIAVAQIDYRRGQVIDEINVWVRDLPDYVAGAQLRADVLGSLVDRMAGSWVASDLAIERDGARSDSAHKHWTHLAELVDGYNELINGACAVVARQN